MSKEYKIFSLKLARELCEQGFKIITTEPNREKPWLNVYIFEDSVELQIAVQEYKKNYLRGDIK